MQAKFELYDFLRRLEGAKIHYQLHSVRDGYIMVEVAVPGERWEVEFAEDGSLEVEIFRSDGQIHGSEALVRLFANFSD